jgi:hypothetical protein
MSRGVVMKRTVRSDSVAPFLEASERRGHFQHAFQSADHGPAFLRRGVLGVRTGKTLLQSGRKSRQRAGQVFQGLEEVRFGLGRAVLQMVGAFFAQRG